MKHKTAIDLYNKLYLIRKAEETIIKYYNEDDMKTPMHMSMGEEAICAGICYALLDRDQVFGTYRSHALYLAKTENVEEFFLELYGKKNKIANGKAGSMHLSFPEKGFMATSAIVSGSIPMAIGASFANKYKKNNNIVCVFFGDGAIDEGNFWESLNIACLWQLPIIFICEDNGFAVHTSASLRHGYKSICKIIENFNCKVVKINTTDTYDIYQQSKNIINDIRCNSIPYFMHCSYYRYLEHVGINFDFDCGYRNKSLFDKWLDIDPLKVHKDKMLHNGISIDKINNINNIISDRIYNSIDKSKKAVFVDEEDIYKDVYFEKH